MYNVWFSPIISASGKPIYTTFISFPAKWSVASPSATPYSMVATQGFLNLQRVFRNIQNMLRDEFGSPSWWAQMFSIEMFLFPTPISSPPAKKVWKKREDQALFPLGTKQNLSFLVEKLSLWFLVS